MISHTGEFLVRVSLSSRQDAARAREKKGGGIFLTAAGLS